MKFDQKYSHDTFSVFLRDFLPDDYVELEKDIVDLSRAKIVTRARELGHAPSLNVYVLEMSHPKETDARVSIATDAFKLLATFGYDKALVIFKNEQSENYRFSYLTISLDLNEKNKVVAKYSNARRYSFYLGTGAKVKTPEHQLLKKGRVTDTDDLLSRFSLEVVNKQFYLEIAKLFDELIHEEEQNLILPFQSDPNVRKNFVMRLIGRLMFCWFLKQKKSSSGQLVPDELLSFGAVQKNYYHSILEPLFFEILNTQIEERDIRGDAYDKVPYLNGGLFSPQHDDYYDLDRGTFTSRHINTLRVSDAWFEKFFELLETYNFTIDENTVFDQELSVDPEMLGRIFENLLAEINPETGSSERKRTGSYYTPRQIVEYMVDQSLIEYLKTKTGIAEGKLKALVSYDLNDDTENPLIEGEKTKVIEAIDSLKVLDPACGSGAFPIGTLQKVVWILQRIDPDCKLWLEQKLTGVPDLYKQKIISEVQSNPFDYTRKLDVIKNSIFGVDIQPIAVEMSRLRCFLTLVVESEVDDSKPNRNIDPLPNLDFKFVCANTLISLPKSESNGLFEDHSGIEELSKIMSEYFSCSNQRKIEMRLRFTNTQKGILNKSLSSFGKSTGDLTMKLSLWQPFENKPNPWFDPEWMFGVDEKFDVVIGNPPYNAELTDTERKFYKEKYKGVSSGRQDTAAIFYEFATKILSENGIFTYILPYRLFSRLRNHGAFQMFALSESEILQILYLGSNIGFSANDEFMIVIAKSEKEISDDHQILIFTKPDLHNIRGSKYSKIKQSIFRSNQQINLNLARYNSGILRKIETDSSLLEALCKVKDGIVPFIREKLVSKSKLDDRYVRFAGVAGTYELKPYYFKTDDLYLCYDIEEAKKYISDPVELRKVQLRDKDIFIQRKILTSQNSASLKGCIDENKTFVSNSLHSTYLREETNKDYTLEYILGILNSSLMNYYHNSLRVKATDLHPQILVGNLKKLPIKKISLENKKLAQLIHEKVSQILNTNTTEQGAETGEIEQKVDEMVFDLYGLNEEEKEIIRNS